MQWVGWVRVGVHGMGGGGGFGVGGVLCYICEYTKLACMLYQLPHKILPFLLKLIKVCKYLLVMLSVCAKMSASDFLPFWATILGYSYWYIPTSQPGLPALVLKVS